MGKLQTLKPSVPLLHVGIQGLTTQTTRIGGRPGARIRAQHLAANPLCVECERLGLAVVADEVDHVVPLWDGGTESHNPMVNRQALCVPHHKAKSKREAEARARVGG
jgi:5-methylcytosine-specific restriction protein A